MGKKEDSKNITNETKKEVSKNEAVNVTIEETNEETEKNKDKGLLIKIIVAVVIFILLVVGGKTIFNKLKNDNNVSGVKKILNAKYESVECIDSECNGFIVIDGDKLSKYKVMLYNADGKKVANYKVNYDSAKKTTEMPKEIFGKYYISMTMNVSNLSIEKYSIKNKNGKIIYETENKLEVLNDAFIKMTDKNAKSGKYSILNKKGKTIYSGIKDIDSYLHGEYIEADINDTNVILNAKGEKILEGYEISRVVTDDNKNELFMIVKNVKDSIYNYYSLRKKQIIGDSFNSYSKNDDGEYTITKKENDKSVKYILNKNGKQERIEDDLDETINNIKESLNKDDYTLYENSINEVKQNEVLVDSKKDKSFGVLNIKNNKYTKIYSYKNNKSYFYSTVSKLESEDKNYVKVSCSKYTCDLKKSIVYDLKSKKVIYDAGEDLSISVFTEYENGYKVIKFTGDSSNKYDDKYVVFDKNNKELYVSNDNVIIIDKELVVGKKQTSSVILYSVKKQKELNKNKVSVVTFEDKILYKYTDDNKNTIIINEKGKEVLKAKDDNYLKQATDSYIYVEDNFIYIYNIKKDKTYKYKLKENEKINDASGDIISPFKDSMFINNSTDKYMKIVNFKGKQLKKIKKVEISDVRVNTEEGKAFIIVKKNSNKGDKYGLYVLQ